MKRSLLVAALLAVALSACAKKEETAPVLPPPATPPSLPAATPEASTPASATTTEPGPAGEAKPAN